MPVPLAPYPAPPAPYTPPAAANGISHNLNLSVLIWLQNKINFLLNLIVRVLGK